MPQSLFEPPTTLFITGTDTGSGKTVATAALARTLVGRGLRVACFKPVASGCRPTPDGLRNDDAEQLRAAMNVDLPYARVNPVALEPPIAPHIAAQRAGICIDSSSIAADILDTDADVRLVEGVGGWQVPLSADADLAELPRALKAGVILVVGLRLGCLNHALLTARAIRADGFALVGWIANHVDPDMDAQSDNLETLDRRLDCPRLGRIRYSDAPVLDDLVGLPEAA